MSDELTPITRKETFLAKAGGQNVVTPTPITREETFLQAIIDNGSGGGGGTGGGVLVVNVDMQTGVFDTTWDEINTARFAVVPFQTGTDVFIFTLTHINPYTVTFNCANNRAPFPSFFATADNGSDYPVVPQ